MKEAAPEDKKIWVEYLLPEVGDIIYLFVLYLLLHWRPNMLFDDGSTGWHIITGNYILQNHNVPHVDIMSYTFPNKPWIAYEWLSDVIMAVLVKLGGLTLLYVVVATAIAFLMLLLYSRCRQNGSNFIFATFITSIGALLSSIHWLARPHIFTFFGVFIFTTQLDMYYRGLLSKNKLVLSLTAYMLIWANSHPGFLLGLVIITVYLFSAIVESIFLVPDINPQKKIDEKKRIPTLLYMLLLSALASLCTPYGFRLYSYIGNYIFKTNAIIAITDEFQSPIFHGRFQPTILEIFFALTIIGLIITKSKVTLPDLLIYLMFAHLSLSAQRNMSLFVIANLPIIARLYANTKLDSPAGKLYVKLQPVWKSLIDKLKDLNKGFTDNEQRCTYHLLPILTSLTLVIIALCGGKVFGYPVLKADFDEHTKPNTTLTIIKELHLDPKHGLSMDNWGGIIRFKIDYPVFIDDRADFYGQDFYTEYGKLMQTSPGWQRLLKKYQIEWVLLPKNSRLIEELKQNNHWQIKAEDQGSVLIIQKSSATTQEPNLTK